MKIVKHPDVETPHGNTMIWRYMGLDKFLDLLIERRLFFVNAKNLTDEYEISLPENVIKNKKEELYAGGLRGRDLEEELAVFQWQNMPMRDLTFVNCWSMGTVENYALWKIYLDGAKVGISIKSNIGRLKNAIIGSKNIEHNEIYMGKVNYTNSVNEDQLSRYSLITTKKQFYDFENELRLFIVGFPRSEGGKKVSGKGISINVNLDQLIDQIYVSPFVGEWFYNAIKETVRHINPKLVGRLRSSLIKDS